MSGLPSEHVEVPALRSSKTMQEVRIDYLLEEKFPCDPAFVRAFLAAVSPDLTCIETESVVHSLNDGFGEADVAVVLRVADNSGRRFRQGFLVENKINASFQPRQAERYGERAAHGVGKEFWDACSTVLIAAHRYIERGHGFDHAIPLETVRTWIADEPPERHRFKTRILEEAVDKTATSGVKIVDEAMTAFRAHHFVFLRDFNASRGTDFTIRPPSPTWWDDSWFEMKSPSLPGCTIRHLARTGIVDLLFNNRSDPSFRERLAGIAPSGITVTENGRRKQHTALQLATMPIRSFDDFARERGAVEEALEKARRLHAFVTAHAAVLHRSYNVEPASPGTTA